MGSDVSLRASRRASSFYTSTLAPQLIPELVLLPLAVALNLLGKLQWGLLALLAVSALARSQRRPSVVRDFTFLPALGLLILVLMTFRSMDQLNSVIRFFFVFVVLFAVSGMSTIRSAFDSLLAGMTLYLTVNIVAWLAGFRIKSPGRILGETSSPFFKERVVFPFTVSVNEPPYVAAAVIVGVAALIVLRCRPPWYLWIGIFAGAFVILASNNRTTAGVVIGLTAAMILAPTVTRKAAPWVIGGGLLLPFYVGALKPVLDLVAALLKGNSYMSRGGSADDIASFEGRRMIWSGYMRFWTEHFPGVNSMLFGYGNAGHVKSGAYLFVPKEASGFLKERTYLHSHNALLQSTFETGFIGAAVLFGVAVLVVYRYSRSAHMLPAFAVATALVAAGIWEPSLVPGVGNIVAVLIVYVAFFTPARRRNDSEETPTDVETTPAPGEPVAAAHSSAYW